VFLRWCITIATVTIFRFLWYSELVYAPFRLCPVQRCFARASSSLVSVLYSVTCIRPSQCHAIRERNAIGRVRRSVRFHSEPTKPWPWFFSICVWGRRVVKYTPRSGWGRVLSPVVRLACTEPEMTCAPVTMSCNQIHRSPLCDSAKLQITFWRIADRRVAVVVAWPFMLSSLINCSSSNCFQLTQRARSYRLTHRWILLYNMHLHHVANSSSSMCKIRLKLANYTKWLQNTHEGVTHYACICLRYIHTGCSAAWHRNTPHCCERAFRPN